MQLWGLAWSPSGRLSVMRGARRLAALALLGCSGAVWADGEALKISVVAPQGGCMGTLRRVSPEGEALWQRAAEFPVEVTLPSAEVSTRLEASCNGFWSAPLELPAGAAGDGLELAVVPAGSIHGKVLLSKGAPRPAGLSARLLRPLGIGAAELPLLASCTLKGVSFRCELPAGKLDLSLGVPGFAPTYLWGLDVKRGVDREVGPVRLALGASVAGWVVVPSTAAEPVITEVAPETTGWLGDPAKQAMRLRTARASTDTRGFFQLTGLAAGAYRLRVTRSDLAPTDLSIELQEGKELALPAPLRLGPPITLEAFVRPAEAGGRPLSGVLEREVPRTNVVEPVARRKVRLDGSWSARKLVPGRYTFRVVDDANSTLFVSEIEVEPGMAPLAVDLDFVEVDGRVTMGESEPVQGEVVFGTLHRQPNFVARSDQEGHFTAFLPRSGEWLIEVVEAETTHRAPAVDVQRRGDGKPTWVDVRLPDTLVSGHVREKGEPVGDAIVLAQLQKDDGAVERAAFSRSLEDGTFRLRGVRPGKLLLRAYTRTSSSRWQPLQLDEGRKADGVDLELSRQVEVAGSVIGAQGPIPGAYVVGVPVINGNSDTWQLRGVSGADGRFVLEGVDGMAEALDLLVVAAGYGVRMFRTPLQAASGSPVEIRLSEAKGELLFGKEDLARSHWLGAGGAWLPLGKLMLPTLLQVGLAVDGKDGLVLAGMAPGPYALCGEPQSSCVTGELRENERLPFGSPQ